MLTIPKRAMAHGRNTAVAMIKTAQGYGPIGFETEFARVLGLGRSLLELSGSSLVIQVCVSVCDGRRGWGVGVDLGLCVRVFVCVCVCVTQARPGASSWPFRGLDQGSGFRV